MLNAEERIEEMRKRAKGQYITQGVSFNKDCPRQLELLRFALSDSASFSGLVKEMLALRYNKGLPQQSQRTVLEVPREVQSSPISPIRDMSSNTINQESNEVSIATKPTISGWT